MIEQSDERSITANNMNSSYNFANANKKNRLTSQQRLKNFMSNKAWAAAEQELQQEQDFIINQNELTKK